MFANAFSAYYAPMAEKLGKPWKSIYGACTGRSTARTDSVSAQLIMLPNEM